RRYPRTLVRQALRLDPSRLKKPMPKQLARTTIRRQSEAAFLPLPPSFTLSELESSSPPSATGSCRLQLERPDGSRLTLTLPALDNLTLHRLVADFLRGSDR